MMAVMLRNLTLFACLALPWLNPFAPGPSAAMVPWLVSLGCVGAVVALGALRYFGTTALPRLPVAMLIFFAANALYFALRTLGHGANVEAGATLLAWGCVLLMAVVGAGLRVGPDINADVHAGVQADTNTDAATAKGAGKGAGKSISVRGLAMTWLVVALLSVVMALAQYLQIEAGFAPWISQSEGGVAYANLRQRNQFATLCGVGLLALLYLCQSKPVVGTRAAQAAGAALWPARWQAAWPWLVVAVLAVGNGLSSSRTGALQWLLMAAAVLCWRASLQRRVLQLGLGALVLYVLVVALMPWFADAVGNPSSGLWGRAVEDSVPGGGRLWLYRNVLELIAQKPWLGWGWRELAYAHYSSTFNVRFIELLDNAHNLPLHLAVELGAPYATLFCAAVLVWVLRAKPWHEADAVRQLAWGVLMLLGVHSMVEYPLWYGPFLMTLGLCLGLLQVQYSKPNRPVAQGNAAQVAIKYIVIGLLCITAFVAFDYHRASQIYLSEAARSPRYADNALDAAQRSVLFQKQALFAQLVTTPVTPQTAAQVLALAIHLVHYSPEPRVIEALVESAVMLHFDDIAMQHIALYKAMYPADYAAWTALK